jgi:hypothetical protein
MRKALLVLLLPALLLGCGGEDGALDPQARAKPKPKQLTLKVRPLDEKATTKAVITIRGRVTPGARVSVGEKEAHVRDERFSARIRLKVGVNRIKVVARKAGHVTKRRALKIKRRKPVVPPTQAPQQGTPQNPSREEVCDANVCPPGTPPIPPEERQIAPEDRGNCPPGQIQVGSGCIAPD